jgi:hypothetical protein
MTWTAASSPRLTRCNTVWRETPSAHCLAHRQEVLTGITVEAILEVFGEANTPRCARCRLLAGNNAVWGCPVSVDGLSAYSLRLGHDGLHVGFVGYRW